MKRLLLGAAALACIITTTGCTGKFNLTRQLYKWHTDFESKWTDETFFAILNLTGIYPVAVVFDAFIFNVIEFWSGERYNPVRDAAKVMEADDGTQITLQNNGDGTLTVTTASGSYVLERGPEGVTAKDADGQVLLISQRVDQHVEVRGADGAVKAFDL